MTTLTSIDLSDVRPDHGSFAELSGAPVVAISSVKFNNINGPTADDPMGYETARFQASLAASRAYKDAGIPQIVMFDTASHYQVPIEFGRAGAIVVPTPRSGLATPYLDAARLVQMYSGDDTAVLKAEADKLISPASLYAIRRLLHEGFDVLVGDRSVHSMETMSPMQQRTETALDATISSILDIPRGASSGVQVYGPNALAILLNYEGEMEALGNNWKYLVFVPAAAEQMGLKVTGVEIEVLYDAAMVAAENTTALHLKRLEQLLAMIEGSHQVAELLFGDETYLAPTDDRLAESEAALKALRAAAA